MQLRRKLCSALLILGFTLLIPSPSGAWWLWVSGYPVQEGTQLGRLAASIHEISEQVEMIRQHLAMLNSLKSRLLKLGTGQIMNVFTEAQSILKEAQSLTADIGDFGAAFKEHFPDYELPGVIATKEGTRMDDQWRKMSEGYLEALNMTAKNFEDEQQARNQMMETLTETDTESGQTKAIQIIGAMVNHAAFLLDRSNQELGGFMENYLSRQQMERERQKIARQNVSAMGKAAKEKEKPGTTFTPGFK